MINIAVCDDSRNDVERLEQAFDGLACMDFDYDIYFSADELLNAGSSGKYQMYILDIGMPGMTGLELAKGIRKNDAKALFVFLTSYTEYVMEVFDVITFDYIEKPITPEKLEYVLKKAVSYLGLTRRDFVFQFRKSHFRISCDDILYIEKIGRQAVIHTASGIYKANMNTGELWRQLDRRVFTHIHISYIVNLGHIKAVDGDDAVLDSGERLAIARSHKQELREKHLEYMKRTV